MKQLVALVKRDSKMFFKDKGMFFTAMVTPLILLFLYISFLGNLYKDSFELIIGGFKGITDDIINACVGGQLFASLLAVCCVTVSFSANMLMIQDKATGIYKDFSTSPAKNSVISIGYYISTFLTTFAICIVATVACLIYIASVGWYMSVNDILFIVLDMFLLVMFGTALSSIINCFLSTQGQMSAVGTIISAGYGFICGAYMPLSQFPKALQNVVSFLPGTYGTALIKTHAMQGVLKEIESIGFPKEAIGQIKDSIDCNIYFFDTKVSVGNMYIIMCAAVMILIFIYILINSIKSRRKLIKANEKKV